MRTALLSILEKFYPLFERIFSAVRIEVKLKSVERNAPRSFDATNRPMRTIHLASPFHFSSTARAPLLLRNPRLRRPTVPVRRPRPSNRRAQTSHMIQSFSIRPGLAPRRTRSSRRNFHLLARIIFLAPILFGTALMAQAPPPQPTPPPSQQQPPEPPPLRQEEVRQNPAAPCVEPPPMMRWQDYDGPLNKVVGIFARRLEQRSVHPPHYQPGSVLCTYATRDKFILFVHDLFDPITFLSAGFNAGIGQAENTDHSYGQGAQGYGKRFGANLAGQATSEFFKDFAYPSIFSQDPRYYRLAHGSGGKRFLHALEHAFRAHRTDGTYMFNYTEWLGTTSAVLVSNTYDPDNRRGFSPNAQRVAFSIAGDAGFDVLREFWPEVARKFRLPFRDEHEPPSPASVPSAAPPKN